MSDLINAALAATAANAPAPEAGRTKKEPPKVAARATVGDAGIVMPYDAANKCFRGEASVYAAYAQTGYVGGRRVVRFELTSTATGSVAVFVQYGEQRDPEGELMYTVFRPTPQAVRNNPGLEGVTLRLYND